TKLKWSEASETTSRGGFWCLMACESGYKELMLLKMPFPNLVSVFQTSEFPNLCNPNGNIPTLWRGAALSQHLKLCFAIYTECSGSL
ncbi:hypothetical protein KFY57_26945, partial [Salmonella enterica subsp. enterica serovar Typhimurium]|nr:hypothetical protein [Salmonella enterica subsp. enterica serovar Typhimurium]